MVRLAIVEDDEKMLCEEREYLKRFQEEKGFILQIDEFRDGNHITFEYKSVYDIILMDIEMPGMDGMSAAKKIREVDPSVIIIFITSMAQYAIEGYSVRAMSYILKPINYYGLSMELDDAIGHLNNKKADTLLVECEGKIIRLPVSDIVYAEVQKHYIILHTPKEEITFRSSMKSMEEKLVDYPFCKCDASFLVNLSYVDYLKSDNVIVSYGDITRELPISRRKRKDFVNKLTSFVGGNTSLNIND